MDFRHIIEVVCRILLLKAVYRINSQKGSNFIIFWSRRASALIEMDSTSDHVASLLHSHTVHQFIYPLRSMCVLWVKLRDRSEVLSLYHSARFSAISIKAYDLTKYRHTSRGGARARMAGKAGARPPWEVWTLTRAVVIWPNFGLPNLAKLPKFWKKDFWTWFTAHFTIIITTIIVR